MHIRQQYRETLDFLYSQLPMFQRIGPAAFKKDLTNIIALLDHLGNPQQQFPSIHLAGTNGKGSVAFMLAAIFQAHGYKTGLYISPHYKDFRERIRINGQYTSRQYIVDFVDAHKALLEEVRPSFFEITVAMAFDYFAKQQVDIAIIETGLGGRLDSTNVLHPILSAITNISYDHQQFLGDTLEAIAGEKAGIIKAGVPVVIGENQAATSPVFLAKAKSLGAPIYFAEAHFQVDEIRSDESFTHFQVTKEGIIQKEELTVDLQGPYQYRNVQTVLACLDVLKNQLNWDLKTEHIKTGLSQVRSLTRFIGRWQVIGHKPMILCDSAHNVGGLEVVMQRLKEMSYQQLHIVLGTVNDKEVEKVFPLFPADARYYFAKADIPRGLDAQVLREKASPFGLNGRAYTSVKNALRAAKRQAGGKDLIFVGGSIFVVAEVL
ncbi:MAG: folylpolyglutamate synthase [Saprospiraceae bacterium]|nr:MAG: folylpolyglutamate synthase [Saprospiraceae bacterium]